MHSLDVKAKHAVPLSEVHWHWTLSCLIWLKYVCKIFDITQLSNSLSSQSLDVVHLCTNKDDQPSPGAFACNADGSHGERIDTYLLHGLGSQNKRMVILHTYTVFDADTHSTKRGGISIRIWNI